MSTLSPLSELMLLLDAANASRRAVREIVELGAARPPLLQDLQDRFQVDHRLAIYGTLAPGKPNHYIVQPLGGKWRDGFVEGDLLAFGWGAAMGYPAPAPAPRWRVRAGQAADDAPPQYCVGATGSF